MADYMSYVATQEFTINLDNGKEEVKLQRGDLVEFDGLNAKARGKEGQARVVSKVIREGEWLKPIKPDKVAILKKRLAERGRIPEDSVTVKSVSRNITGGKIVEHSDVGAVKIARTAKDEGMELQDLVNRYESDTFMDSHDDPNARNVRRTEIEDNMPQKRVEIIDNDASVVAQVSKEASTDAETKNTSGVEIGEQSTEKAKVVYDEERVAKDTNYSGKKEAQEGHKKLSVEKDGEGVVVKETGKGSTKKKTTKKKTSKKKASKKGSSSKKKATPISEEQKVVKNTNYESTRPTDIGSSTQAAVESDKNVNKTAGMSGDNQDARVVGNVSKNRDFGDGDQQDLPEGIILKTTVGSNESEDPSVEFSSSGDGIGEGIESGEATFSKGSTPVADLSDIEVEDVEEVSDEKSENIEAGDIDISDLLD